MTTPDLTTTTGIAAAIKSAEGQKALMAVCDAATEADRWKYEQLKWRGGFCTDAPCLIVGNWWADGLPENDAVFMLTARTALPLALAELARVTGEAERLRKRLGE